MFEPINARLASSFSRNGINDAATETSCLGETSMNPTSSRGTSLNSPALRALTRSFWNLAVLGQRSVGLGNHRLILFPRGQVERMGHGTGQDLAGAP